jgi:serine acetyltransferase
MIGAGAVVVQNIEKKGTYVGVPVRMVDMSKKNKIIGGVFHPIKKTGYVVLHKCIV